MLCSLPARQHTETASRQIDDAGKMSTTELGCAKQIIHIDWEVVYAMAARSGAQEQLEVDATMKGSTFCQSFDGAARCSSIACAQKVIARGLPAKAKPSKSNKFLRGMTIQLNVGNQT